MPISNFQTLKSLSQLVVFFVLLLETVSGSSSKMVGVPGEMSAGPGDHLY